MNHIGLIRIRSLVVIFLAVLLLQSYAAQLKPDTALSNEIEPLVQAAMAEQKLPAVSVAIATRGKLFYDKAFGMADLENNESQCASTMVHRCLLFDYCFM